MESIDMLVALSIFLGAVLGVYALMYFFPVSGAEIEAKAANLLDAQEVLKRIVYSTGSPPSWTSLSDMRDFGLADPNVAGLDARKLLALAIATGDYNVLVCRIKSAGVDYPVTKVGYGVYIWGTPGGQQIDKDVYERILRSLFGDEWQKYDIEIQIRPALSVNLTIKASAVYLKVSPPGEYNYDVTLVYLPSQVAGTVTAEGYFYPLKKGKKTEWRAFVIVRNEGTSQVSFNTLEIGNVGTFTVNIVVDPGKVGCGEVKLPLEPPESAQGRLIGPQMTVSLSFTKVSSVPSCPKSPPLPVFESSVSPLYVTYSGSTDESGFALVPTPGGEPLFAYAYVRGAALRGLNYTYKDDTGVSLVGLVAHPARGVYVVHSKLMQNVGPGASLCGCDDPGVVALGLRYLGVFVGGRTVPLYEGLHINPGQAFDLNNICDAVNPGPGGPKEIGGCLIPWQRIGRARFLIAVIERNSQGKPPHCGGLPQKDVVVMPLTASLPPMGEIRFATWRRWVGSRPEAVVTSYASTIADSGEMSYIVELWVYRYR